LLASITGIIADVIFIKQIVYNVKKIVISSGNIVKSYIFKTIILIAFIVSLVAAAVDWCQLLPRPVVP